MAKKRHKPFRLNLTLHLYTLLCMLSLQLKTAYKLPSKLKTLPSIDDLGIHFVQLVEACEYEFVFRKSIVRSLGLSIWIQHILIFLQIAIIQWVFIFKNYSETDEFPITWQRQLFSENIPACNHWQSSNGEDGQASLSKYVHIAEETRTEKEKRVTVKTWENKKD